MLLRDQPANSNKSQLAWERDLQSSIPEEEWEQINKFIHRGSLNVAVQENCYKVRTRWYRTPSLLRTLYSSASKLCWRCDREEGTMLHIWWSCDYPTSFWTEVHKIIMKVTSLPLNFSPAQYLLHYTTLSRREYFWSLAMHMVNAARMCIPVHWRSSKAPTIQEWYVRLNKIEEIEELIHIAQEHVTNPLVQLDPLYVHWEISELWLIILKKIFCFFLSEWLFQL